MDDETALVSALRAGEDAAFETLVRTYGGRMLAVARRYMRTEEDAHDVVQDAFIQAFRHIHSFHGRSRLSSWLHRITVNAALMKLRSQRHDTEGSIEDLLPVYTEDGHRLQARPAWAETSDDLLARAETREIVLESINRLPVDYRTVILLRDIDELDTQEVASLLGVTPGVVKTRLHRARQALRTQLERHFASEE